MIKFFLILLHLNKVLIIARAKSKFSRATDIACNNCFTNQVTNISAVNGSKLTINASIDNVVDINKHLN